MKRAEKKATFGPLGEGIMSATVAVRTEGMEAAMTALEKKSTVEAAAKAAQAREAKPGAAAEAKLALALDALTAIAGENDLTSLGALFRMRRRAEEALFRIRGARDGKRSNA
jgi:hypothetical protein